MVMPVYGRAGGTIESGPGGPCEIRHGAVRWPWAGKHSQFTGNDRGQAPSLPAWTGALVVTAGLGHLSARTTSRFRKGWGRLRPPTACDGGGDVDAGAGNIRTSSVSGLDHPG